MRYLFVLLAVLLILGCETAEEEGKVLVSQLEIRLDRLVVIYDQMRVSGEYLKGMIEAGVITEKTAAPLIAAAKSVKSHLDETISSIKRAVNETDD